ncbi:MAG: outer membrane beta-barrel protein [Hyphomonadaceae bacterium]|nr:outer membrane beta-barrel protein [Hyphomonadaceae bacterium]MBP9233324.1 outer membrane beta-barrel protein [Hyphomonadaceae bacterium]
MDSVRRRPVKRAVGLVALAAGLGPVAMAQQAPAQPATGQTAPVPAAALVAQDGVQTFDLGFFKQYNPVTAADMVSRVPGFEIDDGEVLRGFGATAGNVLVNGERPSSKVLVTEQLKRIPADAVAKIELISGSASNVDVRGQTQLVNVVLKQVQKGASSPGTWVVDVRMFQFSNRLGGQFQVTKSFSLGETADLTLDFQLPNLRGRVESFETVRNPAGQLTRYRRGFGQPNQIGVQGAGVLKWRPTAQDTVGVNLQYSPTWNTTNNGQTDYRPSGAFERSRFGFVDFTDNYTAELGADWEHRFSPEFSVKGVALATATGVNQDDIYNIFTPTGTAGPNGLATVQTISRTTEGGERVGRGFATWRPNTAHTIDIGLEGAFNFREVTLDIFNDTGAGPVATILPVSDTRVEETRIEPFITDVWKLTPQLTLESGFIYESSTIKQSGDEVKEREFSYPKPRLIATWQANETDQLRASIAREVAQLDFAEFGTSINVVDESSLIGNPDLEPEKTWRARTEWEHKFGKRGAVTVALFYDQVEDVQDFVPRAVCVNPIGASLATCSLANQRTYDAPGNVGDGTRTGVEVRGALPLAPFIENAEIRFSGLYQETQVDDPQTGESRRFSGERAWTYNVSYRQELPEWKTAWGAIAKGVSDRAEYKYLETLDFDRPGTNLELFAETTQIPGITVRASVTNIFHIDESRIRNFFVGNRGSGVLDRVDERKQKGGPDGTTWVALRFSGNF